MNELSRFNRTQKIVLRMATFNFQLKSSMHRIISSPIFTTYVQFLATLCDLRLVWLCHVAGCCRLLTWPLWRGNCDASNSMGLPADADELGTICSGEKAEVGVRGPISGQGGEYAAMSRPSPSKSRPLLGPGL